MDPTSPEFMASLRTALLQTAQELLDAVAQKLDPENSWVTAQEARGFLRWKETAFRKFLREHPDKIVVSTSLGATEPRYQLASLQRLMREGAATSKPDPEPGAAVNKRAARRKASKPRDESAGQMRDFPLPI